ncbi:MAG TPA: 1-deoxy-D-xylulose-5-phosphate reductoisomerase [Alphaproteobacteria bacterium]|jgi:1-deoxy-D-xylulose-5-phosphate reductoisomerase|nr:1-deoxy-D-xylulose-5-phosphate reductoisomerase [Alphaproteobacteria bacterium]
MTQAAQQSRPQTAPRRVTVLGSTGSIGKSTVDLLTYHRHDYVVEALTAHKNVQLLAAQAKQLGAAQAVIGDETLYPDLKAALSGTGIEAAAGEQAVVDAASRPADWIMAAIVGTAGMLPTLKAIEQGKTVALANKESIVSAGEFMLAAVAKSGATLLPVDSEHNAVFQVFDAEQRDGIARIILTASGGPFLRRSRAELASVTPAEAVRHPNWTMGAKISVDSATMMNKSLEIIEAAYLFNLKDEFVDVLIHPQSTVHSMVEYVDGSILAQMGAPDMRTPIAYTLGWPKRVKTTGQRLDLANSFNLSFEPIDIDRFNAVTLARQSYRSGAGYPTVLNAANEIAVEAFLAGRLRFDRIENISAEALQKQAVGRISGLEDILALDAETRHLAQKIVETLQ